MEREEASLGDGARGDWTQRIGPQVPCLDAEDTEVGAGPGVAYLRAGEPLARAAPAQPGATRLLLSVATPALKAARPPLREGAETGRGTEGARDNPGKGVFPGS